MTTQLSTKQKLTLLVISLLLVAPVVAILICHMLVEWSARGRLHTEASATPPTPAALVLGCSKRVVGGRPNLFFRYRVEAAAELYHSGRCQYLIVSGDNGSRYYDEPTDMQEALVALGVPESKIYRDFAGFRTLDSVVRAREIFGQTRLTIISQSFHNKRAIYIARRYGIDAVGLNGQEVSARAGLRTHLREYFARVKMILDLHLLRTKPKFLGPKIKLGDPPPQPTA